MNISQLNALDLSNLQEALFNCCGASRWVQFMVSIFPVASAEELFQEAHDGWALCVESDWLEAFKHHPKIGDVEGLRKKFAATANWAAEEQKGASEASDHIIEALANENKAYEDKFGFIFIVCATGKSAEEMLALLRERIVNTRAQELQIAAGEQAKITQLRLQKLLS